MKIIITLITLFITSAIFGQNDFIEIKNTLRIETGISYLSLKDRTFSPIVFSGLVPNIKLGFHQNRNNKKLWSTSLSVAYGDIDYNNTYFSSTYLSVQYTLNHLSKINKSDTSKLFLGGQFSSELNLLDYDGFSSASWYTAQKLEPILHYHYFISDRQSITGQFSHPIVSLVSRPGYAGVDEFVVVNSDNIPKILYSRMKIYSLNKLINPSVELKYIYSVHNLKLSFTSNYSFLQVNSARKYFRNELGLLLGLQINLDKHYEK